MKEKPLHERLYDDPCYIKIARTITYDGCTYREMLQRAGAAGSRVRQAAGAIRDVPPGYLRGPDDRQPEAAGERPAAKGSAKALLGPDGPAARASVVRVVEETGAPPAAVGDGDGRITKEEAAGRG